MKKILIIALVLMSANSLFAIEFPKDTLWVGYVPNLINNVMFSRDETKVYVNTKVGFSILDAKTGKTIDEVKGLGNIGALSLDESYFVNVHPEDTREKQGNVEKYDMKTRQLLWKCPKREKDDLLTVAFSENGKFVLLIYSGESKYIHNNIDVYNIETQTLVRSFINPNYSFLENGLAIDNKGEQIIVSAPIDRNGKDYELSFLIEISTGKILKEMNAQETNTNTKSAMFSAKNNYALSRINDLIEVLDLRTMKSFIYTPSGGGGYDNRVGYISKDEKLLISGGVKNGCVEIFNILENKIVYTGQKIGIGSSPTTADIDFLNNVLVIQAGGVGVIMALDLTKTWTDVLLENSHQIILSPNPAKGSLKVLNPENLVIKNIIAFNLTGNSFPLQAINSEINISHLSSGKYFLKMTLANNTILNFNFIKE